MKFPKIFILFFVWLPQLSFSQVHSHDQAYDADLEFFRILNASFSGEDRRLPLREIVSSSEVIVRGRVDSVIDGRTFLNSKHPLTPPLKSRILKIESFDVIKGPAEQYFYVEYLAGGSALEDLNRSKYAGEMLMILREASTIYAPADVVIEYSEQAINELPEASKLYNLKLQSTLFIVVGENVGRSILMTPLGIGGAFGGALDEINSLDALEQELIRFL